MGIVEFLEARIAEDEAIVAKALNEGDGDSPDPIGLTTMGLAEDIGIFIGPSRLLAECKAKRAIVAEHHGIPCENVRHPGGLHCAVCSYDDIPTEWVPCPTIRQLASVYSDHPEFDASWNA